MKIQAPKRLLTSDFKDDDKEVASKIGGLINTFLEEVYNLTSKNITIGDNLDQVVKIITVSVNAAGVPTTNISFQNPLKNRVQGFQVLRAIGNSYPTSQPFISYSEKNNVIYVEHISGIPANTEFQLVILMIGG